MASLTTRRAFGKHDAQAATAVCSFDPSIERSIHRSMNEPIDRQSTFDNRQSTINNRQSTIDNRQSTIDNRRLLLDRLVRRSTDLLRQTLISRDMPSADDVDINRYGCTVLTMEEPRPWSIFKRQCKSLNMITPLSLRHDHEGTPLYRCKHPILVDRSIDGPASDRIADPVTDRRIDRSTDRPTAQSIEPMDRRIDSAIDRLTEPALALVKCTGPVVVWQKINARALLGAV